jgi:hypothetical protein
MEEIFVQESSHCVLWNFFTWSPLCICRNYMEDSPYCLRCVCSLSCLRIDVAICLSSLSVANSFLAWNSSTQKVFLYCRQFHQLCPLNGTNRWTLLHAVCFIALSPCLRWNRYADRVKVVSLSIVFNVQEAYVHSLYVYGYIFLSFCVRRSLLLPTMDD